jgi:uncharacterized SAM-binding protein YcdF (DUF218 family)
VVLRGIRIAEAAVQSRLGPQNNMEDPLQIVLDFLTQTTSEEKLPHVDAIFIFGHINKQLPLHAARLYHAGKSEKIIVTGKGRIAIPDGFQTEAEYYKSILISEDVPPEHIIVEKESTNSLENILFGVKACDDARFFPKSLILISVPPLLRRAIATFKKQFPDIELYGSTPEIAFREYRSSTTPANFRNPLRLLAEFNRFKEYSEKGDMLPVEVPETVKKAIADLKTTSS